MRSINELFGLMVERRCSHLHLVPGSPIMIRQGGTLTPLDNVVLRPVDTAKTANALLTDKQKRIFEDRLEVDFSYSIPGLSRYRINVFRQRGSIALVIATNPPSPPTLEELGMPETIRNTATKASSGLLVICGPKASGKSHTLAAMINYILETRNCEVVTFENPIDFLHKNKKGIICQRERGTDFKSFSNAFSSLRHQACDILVITEFEEFEVARNALNLAAGGSLVIVTAQAPSVNVMIDKIIGLFPPQQRSQVLNLMSVGLHAIIAQTLLTKSTGGGMVPCFEILTAPAPVRDFLKEDKLVQISSYMATRGREHGMMTQEQALRNMVKKNLVTKEEAMKKAVRSEEFRKVMSLRF